MNTLVVHFTFSYFQIFETKPVILQNALHIIRQKQKTHPEVRYLRGCVFFVRINYIRGTEFYSVFKTACTSRISHLPAKLALKCFITLGTDLSSSLAISALISSAVIILGK